MTLAGTGAAVTLDYVSDLQVNVKYSVSQNVQFWNSGSEFWEQDTHPFNQRASDRRVNDRQRNRVGNAD